MSAPGRLSGGKRLQIFDRRREVFTDGVGATSTETWCPSPGRAVDRG
jgi:hypothetical protein